MAVFKTHGEIPPPQVAADPLGALVEASATLLSSPEVSSVVPQIIQLARRVIAADAYALWRVTGQKWRVVASEGLPEGFQSEVVATDSDSAALPLEPYLIPDVFSEPRCASRVDVYRAHGIQSILVVPLSIRSERAGSITFYYRTQRSLNSQELSYASALSNLAAAALSTAELYEQQTAERLRFRYLAEVSSVLASSLDYQTTLQQLADLTVPYIADGCNVYIIEGNRLRSVAFAVADSRKFAVAQQLSQDYVEELRDEVGAGKLLRHGRGVLFPYIPPEVLAEFALNDQHLSLLQQLGMISAISVPMFARGQGIGVLRLATTEGGRVLTQHDLELATEVANRAAVAIDNARLHRELERASELVGLTQEAASTGSWFWDPDAPENNWWSAETYRLCDFPRSWKPTIEGWLERIDPDDRERVARTLGSIITSGKQSFSVEYRLLGMDGNWRWHESRGKVHRDDASKPTSVVGITIDITARKHAELALKQSEERYRFVTEALPIHVWYGEAGSIEFCNRHFLTFMGLTLEQVRAGEALKLIHPDDHTRVIQASLESFQTGRPFRQEYRARCYDGSYRWLLAESRQFIDPTGKVKWLGTSVDFTDRKLAEQELRAANERLSLALETAKMGDWEWDMRNNTVRWSDAVCVIHGIPPGSFDGSYESWLQGVHPEDRELTLQSISRAIQTGSYEVEYRSRRADGSYYWTLARGVLVKSPDGTPERMLGVCMDISSRKQAEEALLRSEKLAATGRMAATIAHEINNPLEAVTNLVFLAESHPNTPQEARDSLAEADRQLHHVAHIVRQTLGFYRENAAPRSAFLRELVNSVIDLYMRKLAAKHIHLKISVPDELKLTVVIGELKQVIANLITNAIDAAPIDGNILISASSNDSHVRLVITDDGPGVEPEFASQLFQPFFTTKKEFGTGLGLWVSKEIVEKHGGTLSYTRDVDPSGTQFVVNLPAR